MKKIEIECYEVEMKLLVRKHSYSTKIDTERNLEVMIKESNLDIEEIKINIK